MTKPAPLADVLQLIQRAQANGMTQEQHARDADRKAIQARSERLTRACPSILPEDVEAIVFGTLHDTPHLPGVREWLAGDKRILILAGRPGCGKTVAACWAMAEVGGLFLEAPDLHRMSTDFDATEWRRMVGAPLLVVDDLGDEDNAKKFALALKLLISQRAAHGGRTILTTNEPAAKLKQRYDSEKLWDRIAQSCVVLSKDGPSLRRAPATDEGKD